MPWYTIAALACLVLCGLGNIALVGKPRERKTTGAAMADTVMIGLLIWAVLAGAA